MTQYIALLRGINVGGNNKVPMSELKTSFESAGFTNVTTYINSGNVLFDSAETDKAKLVSQCEGIVKEQFGIAIRIAVIAASELDDALNHAPGWWGDETDSKHNAIVVIAPASAEEVMAEAGDIKPEYEKLAHYGNIIFWSAPIQTFGRTRWAKIVGTKTYQNVTIRNANTMRKLQQLAD